MTDKQLTDEQLMTNFHEALRGNIKKSDLSIEEWANRSGLNPSTISNIFSSCRSLGAKTIRGIAKNVDEKLLSALATHLFGYEVEVKVKADTQDELVTLVPGETKAIVEAIVRQSLHEIVTDVLEQLMLKSVKEAEDE